MEFRYTIWEGIDGWRLCKKFIHVVTYSQIENIPDCLSY